jgi:hypothetical protein
VPLGNSDFEAHDRLSPVEASSSTPSRKYRTSSRRDTARAGVDSNAILPLPVELTAEGTLDARAFAANAVGSRSVPDMRAS